MLFFDVWFLVIFCLIYLLKCVLARWFLDVSFQLTFLQIPVILETDTVTFGAQNLSFGRAGASTLAPWETMGRSRGHLGAQERRPWDPGLHFRFWVDLGTRFGKLFGHLGQK